jgi:N utilization substance protein A
VTLAATAFEPFDSASSGDICAYFAPAAAAMPAAKPGADGYYTIDQYAALTGLMGKEISFKGPISAFRASWSERAPNTVSVQDATSKLDIVYWKKEGEPLLFDKIGSMVYATGTMEEFQGRVGDIVAGTVRRFDRADVVIDLGKFEGIMPARERVPTEEYTPGERIRALVMAVQQGQRGPEIILSRASPDFVRRLLALEVAELADGVVQIKSLAREPGFRTKIAVWSDVEKVDPVGACVGIRGSRVKNIVRELNNEKVDLFRWSPNIHELVIEALKPAKLRKIEIDETNHRVRALVDAENLSLAIGRKGHNARLASRLTGWHIDVEEDKTEVVGFEQKLEQAVQSLATALGIEVPLAQKIASVGFSTVEALVEATETDLAEAVPDLTPEQAKEILTKAQAALAAAKS